MSRSRQKLRILLVDASPAEIRRVERALQAAGLNAAIEQVASLPELTRALNDFAPHVLLTRDLDEHSTATALRAGAETFVMKSNLQRLAPAIRAALPTRRGLERLTPRQLQVLRLVAEGLTSPRIARKLRISLKTVETHRSQIMHRLKIHDLVRLVHYAVRVGLVSPAAAAG